MPNVPCWTGPDNAPCIDAGGWLVRVTQEPDGRWGIEAALARGVTAAIWFATQYDGRSGYETREAAMRAAEGALHDQGALTAHDVARLERQRAELGTLDLEGTVEWQGDLEESRLGRGDPPDEGR